MLNNHRIRKFLMVGLLGFATTATAGSFDQGSTSFSLIVGAGTAFNENYTVVGAGIDHFVLDGVQLGIDVQAWLGGTRSIYKTSPQARYVMGPVGNMRPFIGVFYRKTTIENFDNLESVGGRVGAYLLGNRSYHLSIGYVFENYLDCDDSLFADCSNSYPELGLSIAF